MKTNDHPYINLQKHLDKQAIGFPATRSGVEIKILKHIFSPQEAEIAACLSYKFENLETIYKRAEHLVASPEELTEILEQIQQNGGIETKIGDSKKLYCNAPLVVGMYEMQVNRLTPEFIRDFSEYSRGKKFGIEFLSTELPQMRTIPVAKSIKPQHNVSTFDEGTALIQKAEAPFVILECICRKKNNMKGNQCKVTDRKETCLGMGSIARTVLQTGIGREISRDDKGCLSFLY
ncbi:hypothetical protein ACFLZT_04380 [Thermodesulfobacteriota bacterium]